MPSAVTQALRGRPLALAGAALVALEALVAALGASPGALATPVLILAPGLALVPLLPAAARRDAVTALAAAPVLGFGATALGLITVSSLGIDLSAVSVRAVPALAVVAGLALRGSEPPLRARRTEALVGAGLTAAVGLGVLLADRVIGGSPIPGNDWAKYVLYADEIRAHGALLIDNPYWMLGVPFREDPGVPALYGAYLLMTGEEASVLTHGIWVFAVMAQLGVFALVRALWGTAAGLVAALLWAVLPITQDILGWHGLPNQAAIAILLLVLLYTATALREAQPRTAIAGFGLVMVGLAATHRLSLLVGIGTLALTLGVLFVLGDVRRFARTLAGAALAALLLGAGVAYDLIERQRTFGGTLSYTDYLNTKFAVEATARDLTFVFTGAALVALVVVLRGRDRRAIPVLALLAFTLASAYAWVVHLPMAYVRMAYFLPLALVPLTAIALTRLLPRPRDTLLAGTALTAVVLAFAWPAAPDLRHFYAFLDRASLRGLDALAAELEPGEVVVTDRCWSFQSAWLLQTRTLPALFPADIQPKAELALAEQAREILSGSPEGAAIAAELGVRYALVDPTCPDPAGTPMEPPLVGTPAFISERLVVLEL